MMARSGAMSQDATTSSIRGFRSGVMRVAAMPQSENIRSRMEALRTT